MKNLPFILLLCLPFTIWAQEGNVSAGGEYSGSGGTMSNSTGQTDFITLTSTDVNIQFGLQQVFFDEYGVPTDNLVQNILIPVDSSYCFNATQTITTAGDGTTFIVESGGDAELIAGLNILMMPGTHALSGSYMLARITTDGFYCDGRVPVIVAAPEILKQIGDIPVQMLMTPVETFGTHPGLASFKVYPNPTPGLFTLEISNFDLKEKANVTIYGVRGERIQEKEIFGEQRPVFSIEGQLPGIYLIRVLGNNLIGIKRIIKQ
jgi:hypothetical protein